jgi:hypothetical protein
MRNSYQHRYKKTARRRFFYWDFIVEIFKQNDHVENHKMPDVFHLQYS